MGMIMHDDVPYGEGTSYTQGTGIAINNNVIAVDADNTPTENSEKPVKSKGVYSALESSRAESASLLKSTVGWTGKNLLKINMLQSPYTYGGITLKKNSDGSISVSGTSTSIVAINIAYFDVEANVKYILTGTPDDIVNPTDNYIRAHREESTYIWQVKDNGNGAVIRRTNSERIWIDIRIASGVTINTTFYPMLRDASITDDTYEPYHESVKEVIVDIRAEQRVLGAKNRLMFPYTYDTRTVNGVIFTVNTDGSITISGVNDGTAESRFYLIQRSRYLSKGDYIVSKGDNSDSRINISVDGFSNVGSYVKTLTYGTKDDRSVTIDYNGYVEVGSSLVIPQNADFTTPITIYPMLRLASDPDDTYVPYAMTNRDITEELTVQESAVTDIISGAELGDLGNHLYKYGKIVTLTLRLNNVTCKSWDVIFKIPEGFRPKNTIRTLNITNVALQPVQIGNTGNAQMVTEITNATVLLQATWITD